jgi:hypothetical protein
MAGSKVVCGCGNGCGFATHYQEASERDERNRLGGHGRSDHSQGREREKAKKVFTLEHKPKLMRQPIGEIADLFSHVFSTAETIEDAEKN